MGLKERTAELWVPGVGATSLPSEVGDGNNSLAFEVGERGVGKPGYLLPTSVRSDRCGFMAVG